MWSRLDDTFLDHPKIFVAGELIGENGAAIAVGMYAVGLMWTNKHLTDGFLPLAVVRKFPHCVRPDSVADALVTAGLWESCTKKLVQGFLVHDFADFNLSGAAVRQRRREDRDRKARERAGKRPNGGA